MSWVQTGCFCVFLVILVIQAPFNVHIHTKLDQVYQMLAGHRWTVEVTAALV